MAHKSEHTGNVSVLDLGGVLKAFPDEAAIRDLAVFRP